MRSETGDEVCVGTGRFASSSEEAEARFKKYRSLDPFLGIQPALLNSADISDYVAKTGMLYPFNEKNLKSSSYEVSILGKIIYWDSQGERRSRVLADGDEFILPMNSIAFITPEPTFRLPDYIAIRFNLKITHVHRGILLGTGPLVDPGFEGRLLIPLHNLTNNDYRFKGGEGIIWVEFTKLSQNPRWDSKVIKNNNQLGEYVPFPDRKKYLPPETLIEKALEGQDCSSIRSSIPPAMQTAKDSAKSSSESAKEAADAAKEAKSEVESLRRKFYKIGALGGLALLIALVTLAVTVYQAIENSRSYVTEARVHFIESKAAMDKKIDSLESVNSKQAEHIQSLIHDLEALRSQIQALKQAQHTSQQKKGIDIQER